MALRVVGAGLPRTGTESLSIAFRRLLGEECAHMRTLPGHPFDVGPHWAVALAGGTPDWDLMLAGHAAGVDWPFSLFWREISGHWPEAVVLLSVRDSTDTWLDSFFATIAPVIRACAAPDWSASRDPLLMMERFARPRLGLPGGAGCRPRPLGGRRTGRGARRPAAGVVPRRRLGADLHRPRCRRAGRAVPVDEPPRGLGLVSLAGTHRPHPQEQP